MLPQLLYFFLFGEGVVIAPIDYGTGPTYFAIVVDDLDDPKASNWSVAVDDLPAAPSIASISVESI